MMLPCGPSWDEFRLCAMNAGLAVELPGARTLSAGESPQGAAPRFLALQSGLSAGQPAHERAQGRSPRAGRIRVGGEVAPQFHGGESLVHGVEAAHRGRTSLWRGHYPTGALDEPVDASAGRGPDNA